MTTPSTPGPGGGFIPPVLPRQPGETRYQYANRRSVSISGETLYQRRIRLGQERGFSTVQARGHANDAFRAARPPLSGGGVSYPDAWLVSNGFTPESTGMTWTQLRRIRYRLQWINENTSPGVHITPADIREAVDLEISGNLQRGWAFERLWRKYEDLQAMRGYHDPVPGRESWAEAQAVHAAIPELDMKWWYYRLWPVTFAGRHLTSVNCSSE